MLCHADNVLMTLHVKDEECFDVCYYYFSSIYLLLYFGSKSKLSLRELYLQFHMALSFQKLSENFFYNVFSTPPKLYLSIPSFENGVD